MDEYMQSVNGVNIPAHVLLLNMCDVFNQHFDIFSDVIADIFNLRSIR